MSGDDPASLVGIEWGLGEGEEWGEYAKGMPLC